jgi:hypothetical protein
MGFRIGMEVAMKRKVPALARYSASVIQMKLNGFR